MSDLIIDPSEKLRYQTKKQESTHSSEKFSIPDLEFVESKDLDSMIPQPSKKTYVTGESFTGKNISESTVKEVLNYINTTKDTALFMANNKLGDAGAQKIFEAMKQQRTIKHLILSQNNISNFAMAGLADLLKVNHEIGWLVMGNNKIGDNGGKMIAASLSENNGLKHIVLTDNELTDEGVNALIEGISKHNGIESLFIENNSTTEISRHNLELLKQEHPTFKRFSI